MIKMINEGMFVRIRLYEQFLNPLEKENLFLVGLFYKKR